LVLNSSTMARINLDQLAKRRLYDKDAARKSQAWFQEQIKYLGDAVSPNAIMSNAERRRDYIIPGQMYLYFYHPKGIKDLPYYDVFPLVLPFSRDAETFTGINFHYLPTKLRVVLLKNLLDFATDKKLDEKSRIQLQWQFIGNVSKYRGVQAAVKKYRYDHVQGQFLFIPATQWFNAVMLPVERFRTGPTMSFISKDIIWQDSQRYM
jgi:hypothetical protein